jgi:hypothetical protein
MMELSAVRVAVFDVSFCAIGQRRIDPSRQPRGRDGFWQSDKSSNEGCRVRQKRELRGAQLPDLASNFDAVLIAQRSGKSEGGKQVENKIEEIKQNVASNRASLRLPQQQRLSVAAVTRRKRV